MNAPVGHALRTLSVGRPLDADATAAAIAQIIDGAASDAEIAALLTAIHLRGETANIVAGAARAVHERMTRLKIPGHLRPLVDTCGTGGDGAGTFNISTATAIVLAACDVRVAKHGNRSASGVSGSADVLAALGVRIDAPHDVLIRCLEEVNVCFIFAPSFHPALRHAAAVRKQLPFPTVFNLVGPLVNPAEPEFQLIGVPSARHSNLLADALRLLASNNAGARRAVIVHGLDGLDEVTLSCKSHFHWVGESTDELPREARSDDYGLPWSQLDALRVANPAESASLIRALVRGQAGPPRDVVLANAALGLLFTARCGSLREGASLAARAIDSGRCAELLDRWITISNIAVGS